MRGRISRLFKKEALNIFISIILVLILINVVMIGYYRKLIVNNNTSKELIIEANLRIERINKYVNLVDLGLRGYVAQQDQQFLTPYNDAMTTYQENLDRLREILEQQGYDVSSMEPAEKVIQEYVQLVTRQVELCKKGEIEEVLETIREDHGYDAWKVYSVFVDDAFEFEDQLAKSSSDDYDDMIFKLTISHILLVLLGLPILILTIYRNRANERSRKQLFRQLFESNRKYVFNSGEEMVDMDEELVIYRLIDNLKKASAFIGEITSGNYYIKWEGLTDDNEDLNKENIAGELVKMRDQMKRVKEEDKVRIWTTEGLSKFAEIIRMHENNFKMLSENIIANIVKYLKAEQGGLFILNDEDEHNEFLELMGCYAYDRMKYQERKIEIGQGLIGQCYLEQETIYLKEIPQDYVYITSGLGTTRPKCLLLVPLKFNERIEGVLEVASLKEIQPYEIEFLEKLGESIASAVVSVRTNERTTLLLEKSQQQAEEMRAQEEEMRQNMEELQATQEQMTRKNSEIEGLLKDASEREEKIKAQNDEMIRNKDILEAENAVFTAIMDNISDRITVKDTEGKYLRISRAKSESLRKAGFSSFIGKTDKELFGEDHFLKSYSEETELMRKGVPRLNQKEKIKIEGGEEIWAITSRIPYKNSKGEMLGTLAITKNINDLVVCQEELERLKKQMKKKS